MSSEPETPPSELPGELPSESPKPAPVAREALVDRERSNPYFRWMVHLGLPVTISICLHAGLFALMALKTWEVLAQQGIDVGEYEASLRDDQDDLQDAFMWPGETVLETPDDENMDIESFRDVEDLAEDFRDLDSVAPEDPGGFGVGDGGRSGVIGIGAGAGEGGGGGFGLGFGRGAGIGQAGVWGKFVTGNKFAYVVDFSGSIIVAVGDLKRELKRSISRLTPTQAFTVFIFYSSGSSRRGERFVTENFEADLQPAIPAVRQKFFQWIDRKAPMGSTEPLQAIKRALALRPDAVFFFSDGYFDDSVVDEITTFNRRTRAHIHCFVFDELLLSNTDDLPPRLTDGARRLKRIADQNHGVFKMVTGRDLQRR